MPKPESGKPESSETFTLSPLAQLGAVTGRFVHDLANEISSASTILTLVQDPEMAGAPAKEDLDELDAALQRAVTLIHTFGATVRALRPSPEPIPLAELQSKIEAFFSSVTALPLKSEVSLDPQTAVICNVEWLLHCISYLAAMSKPGNATASLSLVSAKEVKQPADYYSIDRATHYLKIAVISDHSMDVPTKPSEDNLPFLVARELLRHMRGFLLYTPQGSGSEFGIYLCVKN